MTDITELAQRKKFEAWFKSSFHPDKTGPYIKDQLYFAWKAAGAELVEALEKAQAQSSKWLEAYHKAVSIGARYEERIAELESRTVTDWIEHDGKWRPDSLSTDELVYLKTRKQELKIPYRTMKDRAETSKNSVVIRQNHRYLFTTEKLKSARLWTRK